MWSFVINDLYKIVMTKKTRDDAFLNIRLAISRCFTALHPLLRLSIKPLRNKRGLKPKQSLVWSTASTAKDSAGSITSFLVLQQTLERRGTFI